MPKLYCNTCDKQISGKYFQDSAGKPKCVDCAEKEAGVCMVCNKTMLGAAGVSVDGKSLHADCFRCCSCMEPITGGFQHKKNLVPEDKKKFCKDTDFMCGNCSKDFQKSQVRQGASPAGVSGGAAPRAPKPSKKAVGDNCSFCGKPLLPGEEAAKTPDGNHFHTKCFKCSKCGDPIKGSFVKGSSGIVCPKCIPKCAGCGGDLNGAVMTADGKSYHVKGPDGNCCFRCKRCKGGLDNGYFPDPADETNGDFFCENCYAMSMEKLQNSKHDNERKRKQAETQKQEMESACVWNIAYKGNSAETLFLFDNKPKPELVKADEHVGVLIDANNELHVGQVNDISCAVNIAYLVEACKYINENGGREPVFSLDPADPHDLGGAQQKKRFIPEGMMNGPLGEVLFQADYFLKKFSFGDIKIPGVNFPSLFDTDHQSTGARQWFTIKSGEINVSPDNVVFPKVVLQVEARRLEKTPEGYKDAPMTSDNDPALIHAKNLSANLEKVRQNSTCVNELYEVAKAITLAKWLTNCKGFQINEKVSRYNPRPILKEINTLRKASAIKPMAQYPNLIPTLRKEEKRTKVKTGGGDGGIEVEEHVQSMFGGVDLSVPAKALKEVKYPKKAVNPQVETHQFPLLLKS